MGIDRSPTVMRGGIPEGTIRHGTSSCLLKNDGVYDRICDYTEIKKEGREHEKKKSFRLGFRGEYRC